MGSGVPFSLVMSLSHWVSYSATNRIRRFMARHVEHIVFAVTMFTLAVLVGWWYVLARRLSGDYFNLVRAELTTRIQDPARLAEELRLLDGRLERRLFMIQGEGSLFVCLVLVSVVVLFVVARDKRQAKDRMERVLQFTTHELKTPIAGVRALLQSLALGSIPQPDVPRFLAQGVSECNRLEHMAEAILAFQRASSRAHTRLEAHDAHALIDVILQHRARTFTSEVVHRELLDGEQRVMVDPDAFRVIVENLLDNARKYGASDKGVTLREVRDGAEYQLVVSDRGLGFDAAQKKRVFEPFSRGEHGATPGSGLGLFLSQRLARELGGDLTADSAGPGKGASFTVTLKRAVS